MPGFFSKKLNNAKKSFTFDDVLLRPNFSSINREVISLKSEIARGIDLDIPFISSPMDTVTNAEMAIEMARLGGLGIIHRNLSLEKQIIEILKIKKLNLVVSAVVGPYDIEWAKKLYQKTGLRILTVDNAHAHTDVMQRAIKTYKKIFPTVIVGNIATKQAAITLIKAGADALKVGIGSGSICTTRINTGIGVPQLSAIAEVADVAIKYKIPVIADGGIRNGGDIAKALAVGASAVILGNMIAGTSEAPGKIVTIKNEQYKSYRGMGSLSAMKIGSKSRYNQSFLNVDELVPEGIEGLVLYKGKTEKVLKLLVNYLKSTFFYCGAATIQEFRKKAKLIKVTNAGLIESHPHDISKI